MEELTYALATLDEVLSVVLAHKESLPFAMDSYLEDRFYESTIYKFMQDDEVIGYAGVIKETLQFFHVCQGHFRAAPLLFEKVVRELGLTRVFVMTQDALCLALLVEWDYAIEKQGCWFVDSRISESAKMRNDCTWRAARIGDIDNIRSISGDFFDDVSGGMANLNERIAQETIFVLEKDGQYLGFGIIEKGRLYKDTVSIGMFTNPLYRKQGVAATILLKLKEWAYGHNLRPVAGCWYYNTLSRRSLEAAGMIAVSLGYTAILQGKIRLPLRTGNPPGEAVE